MARIRTVKPQLFQHELLQKLEEENPQLKPMLVFIALFGHCDVHGIFPYKPRTLKLHILPFLEYSIEETLQLLEKNNFLGKYSVNGEQYGIVFNFKIHQRITGTEATDGGRYPLPAKGKFKETFRKHSGNNAASIDDAGKEGNKERNKERKGGADADVNSKIIFSKSDIATIQKFQAYISSLPVPFCNVSAKYYFNRAKNGNYIYANWKDAILLWLNQDKEKGKLKYVEIPEVYKPVNANEFTSI